MRIIITGLTLFGNIPAKIKLTLCLISAKFNFQAYST